MKKIFMLILSFAFVFSTVSCSCKKNTQIELVEEQYGEGKIEFLESYDKLKELFDSKSNFVFYMYGATCSGCHKFTPVLDEYVKEKNIVVYAIEVMILKAANPDLAKTLRYTPAVAIIEEGELSTYICGNCDGQTESFKNKDGFGKWFESHVVIK